MAPQKPRLGIVAIDIQELFIQSATTADMPALLERIEKIFRAAGEFALPVFVTYEHAMDGEHAIPAWLKEALPAGAKEFVKTTFAATGLASFASALRESGLSHFLLLGSETDVCVLQTALGMREMGFQVLLHTEAVFSSESNPGPALWRMLRSGVSLVTSAEADRLMKKPQLLPFVEACERSVVEPLRDGKPNVAVMLHDLEGALATSSEKPETLERLRELFLLCAWLQIPVFGNGRVPDHIKQISSTGALIAFEEIDWRASHSLAECECRQFFLAGSGMGMAAARRNLGKERQVFLLEDCLHPSRFVAETVPITYKSFYYALRKSIAPEERPSPHWEGRGARFGLLLMAPELLSRCDSRTEPKL